MKNCFYFFILIICLAACKSKKKDSHNPNVPTELLNAYRKLKLPFYAVDTTMAGKAQDTVISMATFTRYFPDTIFTQVFGKEQNITLRPVGKVEQKKECYFATLAIGKNISALYLSVYDSNRHIVTMPLIVNSPDNNVNSASIDKKLTIVLNKDWTIKNDLFYNRVIYAYNNVGIFSTVLTETNEPRRTEMSIVNPLDTFPKRNKYSGEYTKGSKSYLFVRDGSNANEYLFFVHFQNDNGEEKCSGELRGRFKMSDEKTGQYTNAGDPCGISFTFERNEAQVKENGSCGNYRDIKCFFNDNYIRRKDIIATAHPKH